MTETADAKPSADPVAQAVPEITNLGRAVALWMEGLRGWKRHAADVAQYADPGPGELERLFQSFLVENGLASAPPAAASQGSPAHIAAPTTTGSTADGTGYRVKRVHHVAGVNRLPPDTVLEIGNGAGLTIVYGPNAAGKSGFFRILKSSCFTRTTTGRKVLPDAWAEKAPTPEAVVVLESSDGNEHAIQWKEGTSDTLLRERVAVFDSSSVRAHLDERNSLVFAPSGLEIFSRLVRVYGHLKELLQQEIRKRSAALPLPSLEGTSRVSELLAGLSATTPLEELKRLATFSEADAQDLAEVEKQLLELSQSNPAELRTRAASRLSRLSLLQDAITRATKELSDASLTAVTKARESVALLEKQAEIASHAQFVSEPLQPIGTRAWLELIGAATRYAAESYPGVAYPSGQTAERCVLCQQTLDAAAAARMKLFWAATDTRVRQELANRRRELQALVEAITNIDLSAMAPESSAMVELESAREVRPLVPAFTAAATARKQWASVGGSAPPALPDTGGLQNRIAALAAETRAAIERLATADVEKTRKSLQARHHLLQHRRYLSKAITDVEHAVERFRWVAAATKAAGTLKTTELSSKQRSLTEDLLKADYAKRLSEECTQLGFVLPVEIQLSGDSGTTVRTVRLSGAGSGPSPSEILSEGEQRALALADFLTEADIASEFECLIFDDPVTSHDHQRKKRVAERLVRESKDRQVVIFTHDRVFIAHLLAAAKDEQGVACCTIGRRAQDDAPGYPGAVVFPQPRKPDDALKDAERLLGDAKKVAGGQQQLDLIVSAFGHLRTAYEEMVVHDLFGSVVNRWDEQIKWMKLNEIFFDEETALLVKARLEDLSRYIGGHSHSEAYEEAAPSAADLEREIERFKKTRTAYRTKKKARTKPN